MGKGEFPETNHDGSERRSDASDWIGAKTWSPRGSSPPLQIDPIKRPRWTPVLTGNKSLSVYSIGSVRIRSAVTANHPIGLGNGTAQNWARSVASQIIVKD